MYTNAFTSFKFITVWVKMSFKLICNNSLFYNNNLLILSIFIIVHTINIYNVINIRRYIPR